MLNRKSPVNRRAFFIVLLAEHLYFWLKIKKMKKYSGSQKFRYRFDNLMSKGAGAMILLLAILSVLVVVIAGAVLWGFNVSPEGEDAFGFIEGVWVSLMRTLDSGTMGDDSGWGFRFVAFAVTLGGIFIISALIGVLSTGIESKLDNLRKGRSLVIEKNHTLILGWSSKIFTIISELVIANENQRKPRIVILAEKDKVEMEDEIRDKIGNFKNTKVICRNGKPNDMYDLEIANPQTSKSIIILSPEEENPDPQTIKTILAITNNPKRRKEPYHIVAEISNEKNLMVAKMVGKDELELVQSDDIIARIMVQTSRQSGLSIVYTELMDFDGDELYFNEEPLLYGKTFADSLFVYRDSAVIGIQLSNGTCKLNPPMDYIIQKGDKIIAITEDDDTLIVNSNNHLIDDSCIVDVKRAESGPEKILLLGWNNRAETIIREMDNYLAKNSVMKIVSIFDHSKDTIQKISEDMKNLSIEFLVADTTSHEVIEELNIIDYDSIMVLCYAEEMDIQEADAETLITLLHLRRICDEKCKDVKIVSEMLDIRNRDLAVVTKANDFIVSDKLISLLMSQVSENKHLMNVFHELFDADGSEIYLKPVTEYVAIDKSMNFYTLVESAKRKGEVAIGYLIEADAYNAELQYGIVVNPDKAAMIKFCSDDKLIVLAED